MIIIISIDIMIDIKIKYLIYIYKLHFIHNYIYINHYEIDNCNNDITYNFSIIKNCF